MPYLISFLLPQLIFLLAVLLFPEFTTNLSQPTTVFSDANVQFVDFLSYWRTVLSGDNNLSYSFNLMLGSNFIPLAAYYLFSPFNLLLIFFSSATSAIAFNLLIFFKIGCIGLTGYIFFRHILSRNNNNSIKNIIAIILATSYALCGYVAMYFWFIMWLDALILLPLICLGIDKIINRKSPLLYIISLALAIISNYYTGYMLCLFSPLWFGFRLFLKPVEHPQTKSTTPAKTSTKSNHATKSSHPRLNTFRTYLLSSLASVGLSAFILIPTIFAMSAVSGRRVLADHFAFQPNFDGLDFFGQFTTNSASVYFITVLPNIFIGVILLIPVILFFFNRHITRREKLLSALMLVILFLSCFIQTFTTIWHLGSVTHGAPYRHSFIICFFLIYLAARSIMHFPVHGLARSTTTPHDATTHSAAPPALYRRDLVFTAIICAFILLISLHTVDAAEKIYTLCFDIILLALGFTLIAFYKTDRPRLLIYLCFLQCFNLFINNIYTLSANNNPIYQLGYDNITSALTAYGPIIDSIKSTDPGFYRMDNTAFRSYNDSAQFNYNGTSGFTSTISAEAHDIVQSLGCSCTDYLGATCYYNHGSTVGANSLLGVKYRLDSTSNLPPSPPYQPISSTPPIQKSSSLPDSATSGLTLSKNPYALPIIFPTSSLVTDFTYHDPFTNQNNFFKTLSGKDYGDIYQPVNFTIELENLAPDSANIGNISDTSPSPTNTLTPSSITNAPNPTGTSAITTYHRLDPTEPGKLIYHFTPSGDNTYFYATIPDSALELSALLLDGNNIDKGYKEDAFLVATKSTSSAAPNFITANPDSTTDSSDSPDSTTPTTHTLTFISSSDQLNIDSPGFWQENLSTLEKYYHALTSHNVNITRLSSSQLQVDFTLATRDTTSPDNDNANSTPTDTTPSDPTPSLLFSTIPYDENWQATLDGTSTAPIRAADNFLAIPLPTTSPTASSTDGSTTSPTNSPTNGSTTDPANDSSSTTDPNPTITHRLILTYRPKGVTLGSLISLTTLTVLLIWRITSPQRKHKKKPN